MKILVIILIVLFVIDLICTYLYFRWREKQDKLLLNLPPYTVNTVPVEEFYWSYVMTSVELKNREDYFKWVLDKGAKEIAIKMAAQGFIDTERRKYGDGTEKIVLRVKVVKPK